ncbi:MAG: OmpP1/FadL family transporter [Thermovirgaceae bacterium]|nr:OmpP1/FadL family transporter [Thermovirgaceae bacterium]
MRRSGLILCAAFLTVALGCSTALGAGFALYDFSARGNALGGAMVGRADDASAIAFNPAGITQIPGSSYMTGLAFIMPRGTVTNTDTSDSASLVEHTFIPPHFFYTRQMNDTIWFGLGLMTRFGLGTDFSQDWFGRYNSYYANIQSISLNPNIAWKVNDYFSMSVGVEAMWFEYGSRKKAPIGDMDIRLLGDDIGYGWNIGFHFRPSESTRIGLHYRSRVSLTIEGNVDATESQLGADSTTANGDITLPEMYMFGISHQFTPKLNIEVGAIYTGWSSYDSMTINFGKSLFGVLPTQSASVKNYKDVWRYQLGIEYKKSPEWTWRLGYTYDQSPIPDDTIDYQLPMSDRQLFSIGFGYTKNDRTWDFAYTYLLADDRDIAARPAQGIANSRTSEMDTNIFMISYSVRF